jgi:hypothetical protein
MKSSNFRADLGPDKSWFPKLRTEFPFLTVLSMKKLTARQETNRITTLPPSLV